MHHMHLLHMSSYIQKINMERMYAFGGEYCYACGACNRWWAVRYGYDSKEYANWIETLLCPKCYKKEHDNE